MLRRFVKSRKPKMIWAEDLDFFTQNEFSTVAAVISATASFVVLSGIFDQSYEDMFGELATGRKYVFKVQSQLALELRTRDRLNIYGQGYQIVEFNPIGDGKLTHIILKES